MLMVFIFIPSIALAISLSLTYTKQDKHVRQIYPSKLTRDEICMFGSPPSLSLYLSLLLLLHSLDLCDWNWSIFWSENIYIGEKPWRMHTCFLLAYVSVMMIIYQETSVVGSLFSRFSCACFCYSPSSNTILLANSHQFIHRRRERQSQGSGQNVYRSRFLWRPICRSLVCFLFSFLFFFFLLYVKREFYHFPIVTIDFLYWWNIRTFPKRFDERTELFCKWKMSKHINNIVV